MTAPTYQLGRVSAPRDERNLRLAAYKLATLPPAPVAVDRLSRVKTWPMYRNDQVGCCEVAACAHLWQSWSTYGAGAEVTPAEADVLASYATLTGYDPATGQPDPGVTTLDMLGHWRTVGIGGKRITAYVEVDVHDRAEVRAAINLAGGLLVGADLPMRAYDQLAAGRPWTRSGRGAASAPGSWGGHAIHIGQYDTRGLTCTTWGRTQRMSWTWFETYVAEAFAPLSPAWFNAAGVNPLGLDVSALLADLYSVTGH